MKKLTTSVLAVVLTSSFALVNAQKVDTARTQDIEGVVVTALGIKRDEKSLPYATQTVKAKELNVTQSVDVKGAIAGKVAGVQLNGQAGSKLGETGKLRLRGAVSMLSDADPIYVLDGIIVDPSSIDMDNLESVNVLKGPNATALYGQRAQYGVVVMTSKKGAKNRLSVELNTTTNVDVVSRTLNYQNIYGQGYDGENEMIPFEFDAAKHPAEWAVFNGATIKNDYSADESWGAKMDGRDYVPWYAWWKDSPNFGQTAKFSPQENNIKDFYDKALTFKNTISVSGGGDNYNARVSFTNLVQNGIIPNSSLKRNYFNIAGNYKFSERLSVEALMNFSQGKIEGDFDDGYSNNTTGSFNQWFARDLDIKKLRELKNLETPLGYNASWNWFGPDKYGSALHGGTAYYTKPAFWMNPYTWLDRFKNTNERSTLTFSVAPTYKITNDLSARVFFSQARVDRKGLYKLPYSISKSWGTTHGYQNYVNSFGVSNSTRIEDQYDGRLTYTKKFDKFDVTAIGGANITNINWSGSSTSMKTESKTQFLIVPDVYDFSNASVTPIAKPYAYNKTYKSLYANVSLGFNDTYYIDASARNDINSAYLNSDNSFFTYSLGGSILLHNLWEKNDTFTYFKVRAGIAQIASDIDVLAINPEFRYNNKPFSPTSAQQYIVALQPSRKVDANLKPAINQNFEAGVDLKFFRNRLTLAGTYYDEKRSDEPIPVTLPSSSGNIDYFLNSGDARRRGVELSLSGDIFRNADGFNWTTSINFAQNKSTITRVAEGLDNINFPSSDPSAFGYVSVIQMEGMEWGQLVGNGFATDAEGRKVLMQNPDGEWLYTVENNKRFGSILPKFTGGIYNSIGYKGLSLAFSIDFQKGGKFFSLSEQWGNSSGLLAATADNNDLGHNVRDAVSYDTAGNPNGGGVHVTGVDTAGNTVDTYVDARTYFTQFHDNRLAEQYLHDASYIKVRDISLSYELPKSIFSGSQLRGINIGLVARNPWMISVAKDNTHKLDPSEMSQPYGENGQLPSTTGYGVNVKINF